MALQQYNKEFAKQFRDENFEYPATEEYTHNNLIIRQYAGYNHETPLLQLWLSEKMHNTELIRCIASKLETKDIPHSQTLVQYAQELNELFTNLVTNEPYTACYYEGLIASLVSFCELLNTFGEDMGEHLGGNLKKLYSGKPEPNSAWDIDSDFTDKVLEVIGFYNNHILSYHTYFNEALQHESDNGKGIQVTTQVADCLEKLISLTEEVISNIDFTREMLVLWEMEIDNRGDEELYN